MLRNIAGKGNVVRMYEPNTIILLLVFGEKKARKYMLDVTTKEVYVHDIRTFSVGATAGLITFVTFMILWTYEDYIHPHLYLNNVPLVAKMLMMLMGIFLVFWVIRMGKKLKWWGERRNAYQREKYFEQHPEAEVASSVEAEKVLKKGHSIVRLCRVICVALLGGGVFAFIQFLNYSNLGIYFFALALIWAGSAFAQFMKPVIFAMKLKRE